MKIKSVTLEMPAQSAGMNLAEASVGGRPYCEVPPKCQRAQRAEVS